jgi:hypothetical protein
LGDFKLWEWTGDTDFVYTVDGLGVLSLAYPSAVNTSAWADAATVQRTGRAPRNFPDGQDPANENKALNMTDVCPVTPVQPFLLCLCLVRSSSAQ